MSNSKSDIDQVRQARDKAYLTYQTLRFATEILDDFNHDTYEEYVSPVGLTYPSNMNGLLFAIPTGQGTIDIRSDGEKQIDGTIGPITLNIQPDPVAIARSVNVNLLPNTTNIEMIFNIQMSQEFHNCKIDADKLFEKGLNIPESILDEMAKQIASNIFSMKIRTRRHIVNGKYKFTWPVYLAIPPK